MGEQSGRLGLIERAVQRLGARADESAVVRLPDEHDAMQKFLGGQSQSAPVREAPVPRANETGPASPAPASEVLQRGAAVRPEIKAKSAKIKFGELRRRGMITPDNLRSNISFEFRAIKRKLLASAKDSQTNTLINNLVMVTSALPGEGKTFTAMNLALALATERDLHVLLIDGDVIHPSLGTLFETTGEQGLTDLLNGNCADVAQVMHRCVDVPNMSVIFSGPRDEHTPELISSRRTAELLTDMSKRYNDRIVIFDTPPVLASAETASLAEHMHQVIMLVAAGQANHNQVRTALDHVSSCRNVSLVFNKAPKWHKIEGDPYYYYYGSDRAAGE